MNNKKGQTRQREIQKYSLYRTYKHKSHKKKTYNNNSKHGQSLSATIIISLN